MTRLNETRKRELRFYSQFFKYAATTYNAKIYKVQGNKDRYIINLPPNSGISKDEFIQMAKEYAQRTA